MHDKPKLRKNDFVCSFFLFGQYFSVCLPAIWIIVSRLVLFQNYLLYISRFCLREIPYKQLLLFDYLKLSMKCLKSPTNKTIKYLRDTYTWFVSLKCNERYSIPFWNLKETSLHCKIYQYILGKAFSKSVQDGLAT